MKSTNPLSPLWERVPIPLRNKYVLVTLFFFFWMSFVDKHSILTQYQLRQTHARLLDRKAFYLENIERVKHERASFEDNKEKIARERFYMKRENEDLYIIE